MQVASMSNTQSMNRKKLSEIAEHLPANLTVATKVAYLKSIQKKDSAYPENHWTTWVKNGRKETFLAILNSDGAVKIVPESEVKQKYVMHNI
jgi:hypothetical protein